MDGLTIDSDDFISYQSQAGPLPRITCLIGGGKDGHRALDQARHVETRQQRPVSNMTES